MEFWVNCKKQYICKAMNMKFTIFLLFFCAPLNVKGQSNNNLHFDGANDYVNLNSLTSAMVNAGNYSYTIEFWMKTNRFNQSTFRPSIFSISKSSANPINDQNILNITFENDSNGDGFASICTTSASSVFRTSNVNIGDNKCHHIAFVNIGIGNTGGKLYIDGELALNDILTPPFLTSTSRISLGQQYYGSNPAKFYRGELDNIRIWSIARTAAEVQADYRLALNGNEPNLIALFKCNQGIASGNNTSINTLTNSVISGGSGILLNYGLTGNNSNFTAASCLDCATVNVELNLSFCENDLIIYPDNTSEIATFDTSHTSNLFTVRGCDSIITTNISVISFNNINLGPDFEKCTSKNETIGVPDDGLSSYLWSTGETTSYITISNGGNYSLTVTNQNCSVSDFISVGEVDCVCSFYLPNAFTPDGNEFNNDFGPKFNCDISNYEMQIYNRRGKMIFQTFDPEIVWSGTYEGENVPSGIYTYQVNYIDPEGKEIKLIGSVHLVR